MRRRPESIAADRQTPRVESNARSAARLAAGYAVDSDRFPTDELSGRRARPRGLSARFPRARARGVLMRKPHPQPIGITCPNRSATSGGASRIGPPLVRCRYGWRGKAGDPTTRSGAMLASRRMPCAASTGSAHRERRLIDHSGARYAATGGAPAAESARRLCSRSSANAGSPRSYTRRCQWPCEPIACPAALISSTR